MREAIGGAWTLQWILIFLVLITCILAFSINYSKAFRLKNAFLDYIEDGQGISKEVACRIQKKRAEVGYGINWKLDSSKGWKCQNGVCVQFHEVEDASLLAKYGCTNGHCTVGYYTVVTFIYVNIPIMQNFLKGLQTSQATGALNIVGDTPTIRVVDNNGFNDWESNNC